MPTAWTNRIVASPWNDRPIAPFECQPFRPIAVKFLRRQSSKSQVALWHISCSTRLAGRSLTHYGESPSSLRGKSRFDQPPHSSGPSEVSTFHRRHSPHGRQFSSLPSLSCNHPLATAFSQRQSRRECHGLAAELGNLQPRRLSRRPGRIRVVQKALAAHYR